ncbi:unnamed protein product [Cyprideis torosa]|uniref:Uncharacterized protein n=1 Tax=Cyprideis torosa TaxID=163714 RepID=A0A7R8WGZ9_9CRUS|nr:unnamed protein product [Cyprideis torosa]CAG0898836.1 unnamed protein product [Cyprideis torosa]
MSDAFLPWLGFPYPTTARKDTELLSHLPPLQISPFCMACASACGIDAIDVANANIGRSSLIPSKLNPIDNT